MTDVPARMRDPRAGLSTALRYAAGALLALGAVLLRRWLDELLASSSTFLLFYPAVLIAGMYMGRGPGLVCVLLCTLAVGFLNTPETGWFDLSQPLDITDFSLFVVLAGTLVCLIDAQRRARRAAEEAHAQAEAQKERLEREVAERQRVEEMLRRSNEDLEDFGHIVSHDLKEPLRGIASTSRAVLEDFGAAVGPEGRDLLETLVRLPQRMSALLDALMEYSRVGRAELLSSPTDVQSVVNEVCEGLSPWLRERHAQVDIDAPLPRATADRVRLSQVFSNLIANGVKYNESREPRVRIGARDENGVPVFYVADNGIGIDPRQAPRLFRMFSRLHPRDRYGGGTGSGLALTKKTVERHGGRIWFESVPGRGTTFYFTLGNGEQHEPGRRAREEAEIRR